MAEIMEITDSNVEKQTLSPTIADQFFDAEDGNQVSATPDEDDDFLKKIDEAISGSLEPPAKKICIDPNDDLTAKNSLDDIDKLLAAEDTLLKDADLTKNDTVIDEKSESDLLKELDEEIQNSEANSEFEDILNSVQNGEISEVTKDSETATEAPVEPSVVEEKATESKNEELVNENLLELCESPVGEDSNNKNDEELPNDVGFNDEESNGADVDDNDKDKEEIDDATIESSSEATESNQNIEDKEVADVEKESNEEKMEVDENQKIEVAATESDIQSTDDNQGSETSRTITAEESTLEKMDTDEKIQKEPDISEETNHEAEKTADPEKMDEEIKEPVTDEKQHEFKKETSVESSSDDKKVDIEDVKKEEIKVKLNFMKKFATSLGKLSRNDLEELLLEKITEAIVFRSECTELRTMCEKQDEIIDNLKQRIQSITKQYNDLDMIHKRILKDLSERPDQPITPVKITRAVGLQVYQPNTGSNNNNNLKPKLAATSQNNNSMINKRPNESDLNDMDAKRKKSNKIITPMRPPLSEKERATLEKQEATIEQKIRTKVIKPDAAPNTSSAKPTINGQPNKSSMSSTQSIDLTDEDDAPSTAAQQPPALVAILQKNNNFINTRGGLLRGSTMVRTASPNIITQRLDQSRMIGGMSRHPAPLPQTQPQPSMPGMKKMPPRPTIKINNVANGIIVSWTVDSLTNEHAEIHSYQIYAYEETRSAPATESWKHVGDVKALLLPMAVTLTQFQEGQKYHFAVRAVDIHRRTGPFSLPKTW